MPLPEHITCVDCGGRCTRITFEPHDGFEPGDLVAYRCHDCLDRWDLEVTEDDVREQFGPDT